MDLLLAAGFFATGVGTFAFAVAPVLSGDETGLGRVETWAAIGASLFGAALIAFAPFVNRRTGGAGARSSRPSCSCLSRSLGIWFDVALPRARHRRRRAPAGFRSPTIVGAYGLLACSPSSRSSASGCATAATAVISTAGSRSRSTLVVFADLHYVLAPLRSSGYVLPSDFLRLLAYGVLLVGVWRAISQAEFGRAVAEERARVARDIHDGLAQYLFALSTQVSMLESGASLERCCHGSSRGDSGAAGGAVRGARALVGVRLGAVRRRAPTLRRLPHRGRRARRRARGRPGRDARAPTSRSRSSGSSRRGSPTCAGTRARRNAVVTIAAAQRAAGRRVSDDGAGFADGRTRRRPGAEEHAPRAPPDRGRALAAIVARGRGRRSRSSCGRSRPPAGCSARSAD